MQHFNLLTCERELKKRIDYPYRWHRVQSDSHDRATNFVYHTASFEGLLAECGRRFAAQTDAEALHDYALNRWYNFWSARAVETLFCSLGGVAPAHNPRDRQVDFTIHNIRFDHKTSVFPQNYREGLSYAQAHPAALISWLYTHQSQQRRHHTANRLFLVLHAADGAHWKLKAEVTWLAAHIRAYVQGFDQARLHRFAFAPGTTTQADIIWAIAGK